MTDQAKKPTDFTINQRVRARAGTRLFDRGYREGNVYYIGKELVNVEFDYLGTVAAVYPDEIESLKEHV